VAGSRLIGPVEPKHDDEEAIRVERLAGPDHVVPPADVLGIVGGDTGHMMRRIERVTHQHRIAAIGVQFTVGLDHQVVAGEHAAVLQCQRLSEVHPLRCDDSD